MRVLFAEDDRPVRDAIRRAVGMHAPLLKWDMASNLDEALAKLVPLPYCALVDVCLGPPGNTDGLRVLADARARGFDGRAVVLSGQLDCRWMCDAQDLGALVLSKVHMDPREVARRLLGEQPGRKVAPRPEDYRHIAKLLALKTGTLPEHLVGIEDACIDVALEAHGGLKKTAARALGIPRRQIQRKLDRRTR